MTAVSRNDDHAGSMNTHAEGWLAHVPIAVFAVVMGLGGPAPAPAARSG